jgi:hypothetical protein
MTDPKLEYTHETYGLASALVRNPDGTVRDAAAEELAAINALYDNALMASFAVPK